LGVVLAVFSALVVGATLAYGLTQFFSQTNTVSFTVSTQGLALYSDATCTTPITTSTVISLGSAFAGTTSTPINVYVKNTGTVTATLTALETGEPSYIHIQWANGTPLALTTSPQTITTIPSGNVFDFQLQVVVDSGATGGAVSGTTINIGGSD